MIHGSRKSRILAGISANVFGQLVTVGVQLAGVPILLHAWGLEYYGEWLLLFSVPAYIGLSDLGLGTVATTEMSMCIARQDYESAKRVFRGAFLSILGFGFGVSALFATLAFVLPWHRWLHLGHIAPAQAARVLALLTLYIFCAIFLTLLLGAYRAIGRYARGQLISNLFRLLEFLLLLAAVLAGGGVVEAALAFLTGRILYAGFVWMDVRRLADWLRVEKIDPEWPTIKPLLPASFSMMAANLGQNLLIQGLVIVVGITLGAASVAFFSTVRTLCNFAKQVIGVVNLSVFSEYSISIGRQEIMSVRKLHARSVQAIVGLTLLSVTGLKIAGPFVLELWTKGKIVAEEPFFTLYLGYLLINSFWLGSWNMLLGCNRHRRITRFYLALNVAALVAVYFAAPRLGLSTVPIILMISDGIFAWIILRRSLGLVEQSSGDFFRQLITPPLGNRV